MKIRIHNPLYNSTEEIEHFLQQLRESQMNYLASDLLEKNISPQDIKVAIRRAIQALITLGIDHKIHFKKVHTVSNGATMNDCKMTKFGFTLLIINLAPTSEYIASTQINIVNLLMK